MAEVTKSGRHLISEDTKALKIDGVCADRGWSGVNRVTVRAVPLWLDPPRFVQASLTPKEARELARELLVAANTAEENDSAPQWCRECGCEIVRRPGLGKPFWVHTRLGADHKAQRVSSDD